MVDKKFEYVFEPGIYYVGDPGFILPEDDLRMLFSNLIYLNFENGRRDLVTSYPNGKIEYYWVVKTLSNGGTYFDEKGDGWGFDWGVFGVVPIKYTMRKNSYLSNQIKFDQPFSCYLKNDNIVIGHKFFSLTKK
jgi:hypothetical protein